MNQEADTVIFGMRQSKALTNLHFAAYIFYVCPQLQTWRLCETESVNPRDLMCTESVLMQTFLMREAIIIIIIIIIIIM